MNSPQNNNGQIPKRATLRCPNCGEMVFLPANDCYACGANMRTGFVEVEEKFPLIRLLALLTGAGALIFMALIFFGLIEIEWFNWKPPTASSTIAKMEQSKLLNAGEVSHTGPIKTSSGVPFAFHVVKEMTVSQIKKDIKDGKINQAKAIHLETALKTASIKALKLQKVTIVPKSYK
ncbi:MAG: hypothetical protein ACRCTY_07030 [Candidatus Adiutrix sp.]